MLGQQPFFFAGTDNYDFALLRKDVPDQLVYSQARTHSANGVKVLRMWAYSNGPVSG